MTLANIDSTDNNRNDYVREPKKTWVKFTCQNTKTNTDNVLLEN